MSLETYTRGKLANLTGCNSETIRYYEKVGLLPQPQRGDNGYRRYGHQQVAQLRFIGRSKALGFSNKDILELLEITNGFEQRTRAEVKTVTQNHLDSIHSRIAELQKMAGTLEQISKQCDGAKEDAAACPILLSLFDDDSAEAFTRTS